MTSLQISGEAKLQLVCCDQSQQLTVVTRLLQLSLTNPLQNLSPFPFPLTSFSSGVLLNSEVEVCLDTNKVINMIKDNNCSLLNVNVRSLNNSGNW